MKIIYTGRESKQIFSPSEPIWHGENFELLDLQYEHNFDPHKIKKLVTSLWRYIDFLPIENPENMVSSNEGLTPIIELKLPNKFISKIKLDHLFPTGSYKDRGATVLLSKAKELKIKHLVQDSSGNAGASIAAYSAMAKISCKIFVPKNTSDEKITQIAAYGANICEVDGDRKKTAETAFLEAKSSYYGSHCFNPLFFQGTKTFAYEICEQLNWKAPDNVVLPAGNGTLLIGAYIGFKELVTNGVIKKNASINCGSK